jgi:putative endonuclease
MKGYMYILLCSDGSYYTGSTKNLELRLAQHQSGQGANHTRKRLPFKLVYYEVFNRIDEAFYREKQVQGWSRSKKEALIIGAYDRLPELSRNYTQYKKPLTSTGSGSGREQED